MCTAVSSDLLLKTPIKHVRFGPINFLSNCLVKSWGNGCIAEHREKLCQFWGQFLVIDDARRFLPVPLAGCHLSQSARATFEDIASESCWRHRVGRIGCILVRLTMLLRLCVCVCVQEDREDLLDVDAAAADATTKWTEQCRGDLWHLLATDGVTVEIALCLRKTYMTVYCALVVV